MVAYRASAYHEHNYIGEPDLREPVCLWQSHSRI